MAITSGSYTIGSGGDYATIATAIADVTTMTDDLTLTIISNINETSECKLDFDPSGYTFTLTSDNKENLVTFNVAGNAFTMAPPSLTSGTFIIDSFKTDVDSIKSNKGVFEIVSNSPTVINRIQNIFIDMKGNGYGIISEGGSTTDNTEIVNCVIYNTTDRGLRTYLSYRTFIENCTVYASSNKGIDFRNAPNITIRNTVVVAPICFTDGGTTVSAYNNACSDSTGEDADFLVGSGNISNINPESEFISTDPDSPYFLKPTAYGKIANLGLPPIYATSGMDGVARPHRYRSPQ